MTVRSTWRGREALRRLVRGTAAGVDAVAEEIFDRSQRQVPIETGELRRTGKVTAEGTGHTISATASYDTPVGTTPPLAIVAHEDLTAQHDPGRTAKYLEDPLTRAKTTAARTIRDHIRRVL